MAKKDEQPKAEEPKAKAEQKVDNSALEALQGKTIDERMEALYQDHKKMGARE